MISTNSNILNSDVAIEILTLINTHESESSNANESNDAACMHNKKDADEILKECMDWLCDRKPELRLQSDLWLKTYLRKYGDCKARMYIQDKPKTIQSTLNVIVNNANNYIHNHGVRTQRGNHVNNHDGYGSEDRGNLYNDSNLNKNEVQLN